MHIVKKLTSTIFFLLFLLIFYSAANAAIIDTSSTLRVDTGHINTRRLTNKRFNEIYEQTFRPSTAGNEYFNPIKTQLVADLSPNFVLLNTPKLPFFFVASARVNLRLLSDYGAPVKSPSYMPSGTLYFRLNRDYYKPDFMSVSYTHHSNGIRGPTLNPNGSINIDSGKFTTNFYTLSYHNGKRVDKENVISTRYDMIALELHAGLLGKGLSEGIQGKYGFVRVNGQWIYNLAHNVADPVDDRKRNFQNWQRFQFDFTYIADKLDGYNNFDLRKRLNVLFKYYYQFPFMQNVSFLGGVGYRGQDDYNIYFQNSYAYVTVGVAAGLTFNFHKD